MCDLLQGMSSEKDAMELAGAALRVRPLRAVRQSLSDSGNVVWRIELPGGASAALRFSPQPNAFAFTRRNLQVLRILGLPVQSVLATGRYGSGGSYVLLNWIPGRDLVYELGSMTRAQMTRLAERVMQCQRRLALSPKSDGFGYAPIGEAGPLRRWTEMFGGKLDPSEVEDGTAFGALRARLCRLRGRLESYFSGVPPTAFLDDLTTKNILVQDGELSGIIDLDSVCYGDPLLTVGATMAAVAGDLPESTGFYCEELVRLANPSEVQRLAIWFYAALWAIGSLSLIDGSSDRGERLGRAARTWLGLAESQTSPTANAAEEELVECNSSKRCLSLF
jgi:aminoglycoside phosphotransferase (APT) family kinase protein